MYRWIYVWKMGNGDTFSGIGYPRACMVDIHVQVDICMEDGEWGYILWDRLSPSMHDGYPCTGGDIHVRQMGILSLG